MDLHLFHGLCNFIYEFLQILLIFGPPKMETTQRPGDPVWNSSWRIVTRFNYAAKDARVCTHAGVSEQRERINDRHRNLLSTSWIPVTTTIACRIQYVHWLVVTECENFWAYSWYCTCQMPGSGIGHGSVGLYLEGSHFTARLELRALIWALTRIKVLHRLFRGLRWIPKFEVRRHSF